MADSATSAHHIVIGTARKNSITRMLEDSVFNRVLEATPVPVEVVSGDAVSKCEHWGLAAGALASAGGLLALAFDRGGEAVTALASNEHTASRLAAPLA